MLERWDRNVNSFILNNIFEYRIICVVNGRRGDSFHHRHLQFLFIVSQLMDEAHIWMDDGSAGLDVLECLVIAHIVVLHEVGDTQGC